MDFDGHLSCTYVTAMNAAGMYVLYSCNPQVGNSTQRKRDLLLCLAGGHLLKA